MSARPLLPRAAALQRRVRHVVQRAGRDRPSEIGGCRGLHQTLLAFENRGLTDVLEIPGRQQRSEWPGLRIEREYPSTDRHIEALLAEGGAAMTRHAGRRADEARFGDGVAEPDR